MLVKTNIKYTRRADLEAFGISTIWIEIKTKGAKPLLVQALYMQFQRLRTPNTNSIKHQENRWDQICDKWAQAADEDKDLISIGDMNLNQMSWDKPHQSKTPYEKAQSKMVNILKTKVITKGIIPINNLQTWNIDNPTSQGSCLDIIMTNQKDKVISHGTNYPTFSDHALIELVFQHREIKNTSQYIKSRDLSNYQRSVYKDNIIDNFRYIESLYEPDPHQLAANIQSIIQESLDLIAPIRVTQIKPTQRPKLSEETRTLMAMRDSAYQEYRRTNDLNQYRLYKNLRNKTNIH